MNDATHTRESDKKLRSAIANISIPRMEGDNLAVMLCSWFDNPDQEENENGWTPDAEAGCEETLDAIVEAVRRISTPIPLTPSDEMVAAAMVQALKQHAASDGPSDGDDEKIWLEGYFDIRAILQAALNLMGGKK